jgi:uncharacterized protein (TIGR03382 family)
MRIERDRDDRFRVDLFGLPRWALILVALGVTGLVVAVARFSEPDPAMPRWLPDAIHIGGWGYLALVLVAVVSWLLRRRNR